MYSSLQYHSSAGPQLYLVGRATALKWPSLYYYRKQLQCSSTGVHSCDNNGVGRDDGDDDDDEGNGDSDDDDDSDGNFVITSHFALI